MRGTIKLIVVDQDFWFIVIAGLGFVADAVAEGHLSILRIITIVAMGGLAVSYIYRKLKLQREKKVPFLVVVGKSDEQYRDTLSQVEEALTGYRLEVSLLEETFGLLREDWIFRRESPLPSNPAVWRETIAKIDRRFWRLAERIPGRKVYHLFMNGPAALAMALGAVIGSRTDFVYYHFMPGTGTMPYHPVVDFSSVTIPEGPHILKSRVDQYQLVRVTGMERLDLDDRSQVYVAIHLTGHNPIGDVRQRARADQRPVVTIESRSPGTVPLSADWIRLAREVATPLLEMMGREGVERLHLFLSTPLPIAFCVGVALGRFVRASVYNYFREMGTYEEVFKLEEV